VTPTNLFAQKTRKTPVFPGDFEIRSRSQFALTPALIVPYLPLIALGFGNETE